MQINLLFHFFYYLLVLKNNFEKKWHYGNFFPKKLVLQSNLLIKLAIKSFKLVSLETDNILKEGYFVMINPSKLKNQLREFEEKYRFLLKQRKFTNKNI